MAKQRVDLTKIKIGAKTEEMIDEFLKRTEHTNMNARIKDEDD